MPLVCIRAADSASPSQHGALHWAPIHSKKGMSARYENTAVRNALSSVPHCRGLYRIIPYINLLSFVFKAVCFVPDQPKHDEVS